MILLSFQHFQFYLSYCNLLLVVMGSSYFCHPGYDDQHLLPYIFQSLQGYLGDLARSLGKDTTLDDVLQILDEHYDVVMTFDALSRELYSLKQGSGENVAEFGVYLSQQVLILQSEYPGRIQPEHIEEMKHDCFYQGLNLEYQWMLAQKMMVTIPLATPAYS